ncbi:hypothetical protein Salat_0943300 [Sesamum alatum]|uniref:Uncharacterized protein n=1 Tax=Sesamum alatum TaxID=300844 RepID=A0AAE1YKQ3_9LAMI|nr:hypothetical protein Salat_0943300 [Sesamum alatum]
MAGMLPGVEAARRRRFHHSNPIDGGAASTRRSSFCLYATNYSHQLHLSPSSSMERKAREEVGCEDEKLDATTREAKKRLDHRLQTHLRSEFKRSTNGRETSMYVEGRLKEQADEQTDVHKAVKKSGYQIFKAAKLPKLPFS